MSEQSSAFIRTYRWVAFGLALYFGLYMFWTADWDYFGLHFRFLTIWALYAYLVSSALLLRRSLGSTTQEWNALISASVVLGLIVVFMYWRLYFIDPSLVNSGPVTWWLEYYLHLIGPLLLLIDSFFFLGAFRRIVATLGITLGIFVAYVAWIELLVRPLNVYPEGSKENGLPYPFLNNMDEGARMQFYGSMILTVLVILGLCWGAAALLRRVRRSQ